jgi:dihydromonapterin reductase/dihydrofolate reductase
MNAPDALPQIAADQKVDDRSLIDDPILITGVGRRVGLHLARSFLARGIPVIGTYRSEYASLDDLRERGAMLYRCDFNEQAEIDQLIDTLLTEHKNLRAIIHNASEWLPDTADLPSAEIIQRMLQVHVSAPYQLNRALEPLLLNCGEAHADIIHISDYVGSRGSRKHSAYAASKAAMDNLTLSDSARLAPRVKVNSIAPALVLFNDDDDEAYREKTLKKSLMQREAGLDEFQHAVDFLLNSHYVTGRILPVDGGRHLV